MPAGHLTWKLPDGWKEMPPGEMRVASFRVTGENNQRADVSVVPLPGDAGGDLANVNRWRGQVEQSPLSPEEFAKAGEAVEVGGQPAFLYDQAGEDAEGHASRILAVIQHRDGGTWFFKMIGDKKVVGDAKVAFVEFLKSFQFTAGTPAPRTLPTGATQMPEATAASGQPRWQAPADWTPAAAGQFLVAKFTVAGGQASVNISSSAGNGGGFAANVNRWRKQLGLPELGGDELLKAAQPVKVTSGEALAVTMSGTDARTGKPSTLIGVVVQQSSQAWFYKLMGDEAAVTAQQAAFVKFVEGVQY